MSGEGVVLPRCRALSASFTSGSSGSVAFFGRMSQVSFKVGQASLLQRGTCHPSNGDETESQGINWLEFAPKGRFSSYFAKTPQFGLVRSVSQNACGQNARLLALALRRKVTIFSTCRLLTVTGFCYGLGRAREPACGS